MPTRIMIGKEFPGALLTRNAMGCLYRDPALRVLVDSHRHAAASAGTLTGLADDIAALRTATEAIAARVRHHEEQIRQLNRKKQ